MRWKAEPDPLLTGDDQFGLVVALGTDQLDEIEAVFEAADVQCEGGVGVDGTAHNQLAHRVIDIAYSLFGQKFALDGNEAVLRRVGINLESGNLKVVVLDAGHHGTVIFHARDLCYASVVGIKPGLQLAVVVAVVVVGPVVGHAAVVVGALRIVAVT